MPEVGISIIVPAYNEEGVISDCLNSLVNLNYPKNEYEIIIVNDGSTDKTADVVNSFVKTYPNVVLLSKENGGKASAQNLGLKQASGRYILITDADAVVRRDWISKMLKDLEDFDMVQGSYFAKETNTWLERVQNAHYLIKFEFGGLKGRPAVGVNTGFRKEVVEKIGNFNESKTSITGDFIKRAEEAGFKHYFNPEITVLTKCTKSIKGFLKQKLRWREDSLSYLKGEKITFSDLPALGYTVGLSFILFVSFFLSILLFKYQYFLFSFAGVFLVSFLLYAKPFLKMCNDSKEKQYAKYFIGYLYLEMVIRLILIPYLAYRLIKPRKRPTFEAERE
jgi:cellulose synthase/poly-beta-1,6-N-acetylglucosamine synthase-like glycosyltransferase